MAELKYWVWLASLDAQRRDIMALLEHFGPPDEIYFAGEADYKNVLESGWEPFLNKSMAEPRRIMKVCEERGYDILTLHDAKYPQRLKNIFDPPAARSRKAPQGRQPGRTPPQRRQNQTPHFLPPL